MEQRNSRPLLFLMGNERIKKKIYLKMTIVYRSIMTLENIHLNSFMYEPLLDMDIIELVDLYDKVKNI